MGLPATTLKALAFRRARPYGQFRQADSGSTDNGALGCTHTCWQWIAELWTGRFYTHDEISRLSGYPYGGGSTNRGMRPSESIKFLQAIGLPYVLKTNLPVSALYAAAALGPVEFSHSYSRWPEWKGYTYKGVTADGRPNGYAAPLGAAGANQLAGFRPPKDRHAGMLWGSGVGSSGFQVYTSEPNHGSLARPQLPPYDILTGPQFANLYNSFKTVYGLNLVAIIPTRALPL